ncbi:MAG: ABC transporter substrate-binding protein [Actinomycetales bacterium]|nr:ABC transporter substrate-binding protein [Actinomycetales bacterium]
MKRPIILVTALASGFVLAACGGAPAPSEPTAAAPGPSAASSAASAAPAESADSLVIDTPPGTGPVQNVNWNLGDGEPLSIDPTLTWSGSQNFVGINLCESLLTIAADGSIQPGLATEVVQQDPTTVVATLRTDATFWDGTPVTAADAAFSLDRARTDPTSQYAGDLASIASVTATDDTTLTITLSKPDVLVRSNLATSASAVVSKAFFEANKDTFGKPGGPLMCSGPYKLDSWTPGKSIVISANPAWWGKGEGKQLAKQITYSFVTDPSAAVAGMKSGAIDGAFLLPPSAIPPLQQATNGAVGFGRGTAFQAWVPIIGSGGPLENPKLREALAKALDYPSIIKNDTAGAGSPAKALATPGSWGYAVDAYSAAWDALPTPAQDIEAAKQLVAESGVANPRLVIAAFSELPDSVNSALVLQSAANAVGFDASIKKIGFDYANTLFSGAEKPDIDIFQTNYLSLVTDPLSIYSQVGLPKGAANWGGYDNPQVAELLTKALGTTDEAERAQIVIEAQTIMSKEYAWIPTTTSPNGFFLSNSITGAVVTAPANLWSPWATQLGAP